MTQLPVAERAESPQTEQAEPTPWTVHVLGTVVMLLVAVTSYGAYYFTMVFEDPDPGPGSFAFLVGFLVINLVAAASAVGLWRGRRLAWQVLLGHGVRSSL